MSKFVIKKRVTLEFLGDEYKDGYLVFRSIPLKDYQSIVDATDKAADNEIESLNVIQNNLKNYYIEGEFPVEGKLESLTVDDLDEILDKDVSMKCFQVLMGRASNDENFTDESKKPSTTTAETSQ